MKVHKFKQRQLSTLKGDAIPKVWLFTDTETKVKREGEVDKHYFHLGWVFLCREGWEAPGGPHQDYYFTGEISYLEYIQKMARTYENVILCGHNIFFDLQASGFFIHFKRWGWELEYLYDKGMIFILKVVKSGSSLTILSTTNWFDCSLAELGKMVGLEKIKVDFERVRDKTLKEYCYRDTEIVMVAMRSYLKFIRDNELGRFCFTKSSQAFTAYRKRFIEGRIFIHNDPGIHELERRAYMGGRTEAFHIGEMRRGRYVSLDINAMYPYVMDQYAYPSKLVGYLEDERDGKYYELLDKWLMIAEVEVDTPEPVFAIKHRGKTVFPVGSFTCYLCTEGIKYAVSHGYIKRFIRASVYLPAFMFGGYVAHFHSLRREYNQVGDDVMVKLCKYMHNSLYGKFGERDIVIEVLEGDPEREYYRDEIIDGVRGGVWIETWLLNKRILQHYEGETSHSAPAVAAHITENARLTLWKVIQAAGRDRVLYCDTDSIIVRESVMKTIKWVISDTLPGALKIQKRFTSLTIDGAKNYRTDEERHIKGIPGNAKEVCPGVFEYMHFKRMCMCLREGHSSGVIVEMQTRRLISKYDKGVVTSSGEVTPLFFPLPEQRLEQSLPF